ncbi:excisionase family DNA-binding protein [Nocardia sp. NPDC127606]|uniref:excisionase family DNA-binding protein n=1 Tax=Nocardia sp. NPDC127606 TaxID=3345406 RepID=UPI00362CC8E9
MIENPDHECRGNTICCEHYCGRLAPDETGGHVGLACHPRRSAKRTPNPSRYVSVKFAAERAGVSTDTIRRMIADGTLAAYRFRSQIRIAIEDIDAAMWPIN